MRNADQQILLITGATDGLGRRVAEDLAGRGPTLLLHGRNPEKGAATVAAIRAATGNEQLHYYNADFSSLAEAGALADAVAAEFHAKYGEPFELPDDLGLLQEQARLIGALQPPRPLLFRSNHASNALPLQGTLPRERARLLAQLDEALHGRVPLRPSHLRGM